MKSGRSSVSWSQHHSCICSSRDVGGKSLEEGVLAASACCHPSRRSCLHFRMFVMSRLHTALGNVLMAGDWNRLWVAGASHGSVTYEQ